jgi:hypothetical protein
MGADQISLPNARQLRHVPADQAVVRPGKHLSRAVAGVSAGSQQELRLLGHTELVELRHGAAEPGFPGRESTGFRGNKPAEPWPQLERARAGSYPSSLVVRPRS